MTIFNKNLSPIIARVDFDKEATSFLRKYYSKALDEPMAIPIEEIAEELMKLEIKYECLSSDLSYYGCTVFTDGSIDVHCKISNKSGKKSFKAGTLVLDADLCEERNLECVRYTIAHECFHWEKHRRFYIIKNDIEDGTAVAHRFNEMEYDYEPSKSRTDEEWMDWQAENIAACILMPREMFLIKLRELEKIEDIHESIIEKIAEFFEVSKKAARIRYKNLSYIKA